MNRRLGWPGWRRLGFADRRATHVVHGRLLNVDAHVGQQAREPPVVLEVGGHLGTAGTPGREQGSSNLQLMHQYEQALGSWHAFHLHGHLRMPSAEQRPPGLLTRNGHAAAAEPGSVSSAARAPPSTSFPPCHVVVEYPGDADLRGSAAQGNHTPYMYTGRMSLQVALTCKTC